MKTFVILFVLFFSFQVFAESSNPIPPPPMPDYMKKHKGQFVAPPPGVEQASQKREIQSLDEGKAADVKQEFLLAGEEFDAEEKVEPDTVEEAPLMASEPEPLEEAPKKEDVQEVSEVDVSTPEFEQAEMGETLQEDVTDQYLKDAGNTVADTAPEEAPESNLAEVENELETAEQVAEQKLESKREPSSIPFKPGMFKFTKKCQMHSEASSMSSTAGSVKVGRKLWVDAHDDDWHKVYKKSGAVFIPADCLK